MQHKIRIVAGAVVVVAAAYVATSWWVGGRIEANYQAQLAALQSRVGAGWIAEGAYHRGVFHSSNDLTLQIPATLLGGVDPEAPTVKVRLHDAIAHGPLADGTPAWAVQSTTVQGVDDVDPELLQALALNGAASARTVYALDGAIRSTVHLPGGTLDAVQGPVQWDAAELALQVAAGKSDALQGSVHWPGAQWERMADRDDRDSAQRTEFALRGVQAQFDVGLGGGTLWAAPGTVQARAERFTVRVLDGDGQAAGDPLLALKDIALDEKTQVDAGLAQNDQKITAAGSLAGTPLQELTYTQRWARLDTAALAQLQPVLLQVAGMSQDQLAAYDFAPLDAALRRLSDAGPQTEATLAVKMADQSGEARWTASLDPAAQLPGFMRHLPWQLQLIPRLHADASLRLPKAWLPTLQRALGQPDDSDEPSLEDELNALVDQGILQADGDAWTLSLRYTRDSLLLNGKPTLNGILGALALLGGVRGR